MLQRIIRTNEPKFYWLKQNVSEADFNYFIFIEHDSNCNIVLWTSHTFIGCFPNVLRRTSHNKNVLKRWPKTTVNTLVVTFIKLERDTQNGNAFNINQTIHSSKQNVMSDYRHLFSHEDGCLKKKENTKEHNVTKRLSFNKMNNMM